MKNNIPDEFMELRAMKDSCASAADREEERLRPSENLTIEFFKVKKYFFLL